MSRFEVVIGLEVHAQLNTKTKMFCGCATSFGHTQNANTCPVCLALPGALPVPNKEAFAKSIAFGKAINAIVNKTSIFDRKNYFYPDSPKAYQITQMQLPIVEKGHLVIELEDGTQKTIGITRAHLEEDAGKNIHEGNHSKVDLNRAGTPLLEIVSEPDLRSSDEAIAYLKKLHSIIRYLKIGDANMQEGSFRCDANVSIRPKGDNKLYTRVEIKNINSFKFIQKAIELEVQRQIDAWEDGVYNKEICQETRLYDSVKNETRSMRGKEGAADYRYFPEPDIPPVTLDDEMIKTCSIIPELPDQKRERYIKEFGISGYDAGVLTQEPELADFFEDLISHKATPKMAVSWMSVELLGRLNKIGASIETSPVSSQKLAKLIARIEDNSISAKAAKDVLDFLMENQIEVDQAIEKLGLKQISDDGAIEQIVLSVIQKNPSEAEAYRAGKEALIGFFVGQIMKESKGKANPAVVNKLLLEKLKS